MARYIEAVECAEIISEKMNIPLGDLVDVFAEVPSAEVVEVRRGEWIAEQKGAEYCEFVCSICNSVVGKTDQFDETEVTQFSEWYSYLPKLWC